MAKPNYSYEKRQRELAKKAKKEEKRKRKEEHPEQAEPVDGSATPETGEDKTPA
jgi:hypothetical protein